jgi:hypothetical protein
VRFHVGDICQIRHLDDIEPEYRGRECTVLTGLLHVTGLTGARYRIELQGLERWRVYASPHVLKHLPPPNTKVAGWRDCPFQPNRKKAPVCSDSPRGFFVQRSKRCPTA